MEKHLILAEYIDDGIRIGFIVGYVSSMEQAEKVVRQLFDNATKANLHEVDYFRSKGFKSYPIGGDDYSFPKGTYLTNGSLSVFSVEVQDNSTLSRFIHERQYKTQNFEHTEFEKLVDGYVFREVSCIN